LVAAVARLRLEVLDHRTIENDVHALLVRQYDAGLTALAQHQLACGDVGPAQGFSAFASADVFTVDRLLMSVGLAHRDDANVVLGFCGDYRHEQFAKRSQSYESFLAVVEAAILERHRLTGLDHLSSVIEV
jgi:hypothetical protein